jgi:hypothetical protein
MCCSGVGLILVMFDVLDCYILYMCLLLFVYCIPILEAPWPGRQTKQDFFKKNPYVRRFPDEHKANMAPGWLRDYVAYVCRPGGTDKRKGLRFVGPAWPMNVS